MIVTVTPNPSVDQTIFLDTLQLGEINRFDESQLDPAGKGINVSRMAHRLGWPTVAFGFLAGEIGSIARQALDAEGVQHHFVEVSGRTRINVTIVDRASGSDTGLYGPGPTVDAAQLAVLTRLIEFWLAAARVIVVAGSVPPGVPVEFFAELISQANLRKVATILDADGGALRTGLDAGPNLVKPNVEEAERLLGRSLPSVRDIAEAARELIHGETRTVVISMGARGLVCAQADDIWHVLPPDVERRSTVGSGDSLVAGLAVALAQGSSIVDGLRLGSAAGAATAMAHGTALGTAEDVRTLLPQVRIVPIEL